MKVRVLLVDDQPLLLHGFAMILGAQSDLEVVGQAQDGAQALELSLRLQPDVVLMDIQMPRMDGLEATRRLAVELPTTRVLVLTTFDLDEYAFEAVQAGASGFLLKNARPDELLAGVRAVAAGDAVLAPSTTRRLLERFGDRLAPAAATDPESQSEVLDVLTSRERDVFRALALGLTNAEIAARLVLSDATVKTHVARILAKLHLRDRVQTVIFAYEHGLDGRDLR
jgi:DNA-binding NarL/FixJ family response regulator